MRTLDRTRTIAALVALALAVIWAPSAGWADDDNDKKKDNKRKQETTQQHTDGDATVVCCLTVQPPTSATIQRSGTTRPPVLTGATVAAVKATSTGKGPADQEECDSWAGLLDQIATLMDETEDEAVNLNALIAWDEVRDAAEERGCTVIV